MKRDNENLKKIYSGAKQEIKDEVKDLVHDKVKIWREEREKDKISFKEIFEQQEMENKENVEKEVIQVIKTKDNIVKDVAEKKKNVMMYGLKDETFENKVVDRCMREIEAIVGNVSQWNGITSHYPHRENLQLIMARSIP